MRYMITPLNQPRAARPPIVLAPSDDEVKRFFSRFSPVLNDGPVIARGKRIGWKRTNAGPLGAIYLNELTGRRFLFCIDFANRKPRLLIELGN